MKRSFLIILDIIVLLLLAAVLLLVAHKLGLFKLLKNWFAENYIFPHQCVDVYPIQYKASIYDICMLDKYNISLDDIEVKTKYLSNEKACEISIFIKGKEVAHYKGKMGQGFIIMCKDIWDNISTG